jgi:hypothetical protein
MNKKRPFQDISNKDDEILAVEAVSLSGAFRPKLDIYKFLTESQ